jgi:exosome complex component RRP41
MGNTQVLCTVTGPCDPSKLRSIGGGGNNSSGEKAEVRVEISFAGFAGVDRKKYGRNDKYDALPPLLHLYELELT